MSCNLLLNPISIMVAIFSLSVNAVVTSKDFESQCLNTLTPAGYYKDGYCYTKEGPFTLKQTSSNDVCKKLPNGRLMTEHSPEAFSNISTALVRKSTEEEHVVVYLVDPIPVGSTLKVKGRVADASVIDSLTSADIAIKLQSHDTPNQFAYLGSPIIFYINLKATAFPNGYIYYKSYEGTNPVLTTTKPRPASVDRGLNFTVLIELSGPAKIKLTLNEVEFPEHPYPDHSLLPTNVFRVNGPATIYSVSLDGRKIWPMGFFYRTIKIASY